MRQQEAQPGRLGTEVSRVPASSESDSQRKVKLDPETSDRLLQAQVLIHHKNYRKADQELNELIGEPPKCAPAHFLLGFTHACVRKQIQRALRELTAPSQEKTADTDTAKSQELDSDRDAAPFPQQRDAAPTSGIPPR